MKSFYLVLLFMWFILAYFLVNHNICDQVKSINNSTFISDNDSKPDSICNSTLLFKDGEFRLISKENFKFQKSSFNHHNVSAEFADKLLNVARYLDDHPDRKMKIKGYFLRGEENKTDYETLGLARANSVKTYFLTLGMNSSQLLTSSKLTTSDCFNAENILIKGIVVAFGQ